ncbi:hypothetical protein PVAP13_7KG172355 [Panicum virgatum]|uniref:Uncharacterized protein n=1 Tax=Panicum virgatum TaxID=38727 RepID=A0A8T0QBV1_PANVG|nr:hypothetical protein PVAP13_7KG172355 [Panicum virgatum]
MAGSHARDKSLSPTPSVGGEGRLRCSSIRLRLRRRRGELARRFVHLGVLLLLQRGDLCLLHLPRRVPAPGEEASAPGRGRGAASRLRVLRGRGLRVVVPGLRARVRPRLPEQLADTAEATEYSSAFEELTPPESEEDEEILSGPCRCAEYSLSPVISSPLTEDDSGDAAPSETFSRFLDLAKQFIPCVHPEACAVNNAPCFISRHLSLRHRFLEVAARRCRRQRGAGTGREREDDIGLPGGVGEVLRILDLIWSDWECRMTGLLCKSHRW